jgi:hypothetical protein
MRRRVNVLHWMGMLEGHPDPDPDSLEQWRYTVAPKTASCSPS